MEINGFCDPGFLPLRDAFIENFEVDGEVGAAIALIVGDRVVVDLWGGHRDWAKQLPWQEDTLVNVFSIGKAMATLAVLDLVETGALDVDETVSTYWPEFAASGKESITVRQLMSHRAGLPSVRKRLPDHAMFDWDFMTEALAEMAPWWEPGTAHGYHVNTFGFLLGELVRRVTGSSIGTWFRKNIAGPLGADFFFGLPEELDHRVAEFLNHGPTQTFSVPEGTEEEKLMVPFAYINPPAFSGQGVVNTREWRAAEIPSTNGHSNARAVATIYAALLQGKLISLETLDAAIEQQVYGHDLILDRNTRFGLGFQLTQDERRLGPNARTFGHFGAGGALGFADPDLQLAFGYTMNVMGPRWQNPKNRRLIDAIYTCD
ncbi:MAG: serine hydrolase domain-containing protein, partial [Acidimicrobiia bacterium]